jgi:SAM-dependent methyltransferase
MVEISSLRHKKKIENIGNLVRQQYEQFPYPDIDPDKTKPNILVSGHLSLMCDLIWAGKKTPDGLRVLDAGCGTGSPLIAMASRYKNSEIVGIDFSETSLKKARQLANRFNLTNIKFYNISLEQLPELGFSFDYVICSGVLHHMGNPAAGLKAIGEVLDPQGAVSIMLYGKYGRIGVNMLQEAIRITCKTGEPMPDRDRINVARKLVTEIPESHPFKTRKQGREIQEGKDSGIVDLLLHARDIPFDVNSIYKLCKKSGLKFCRWLFPVIYNPANYIKDLNILKYMDDLSCQKRYEVAELLHGRISKHSFIVVKPDFIEPKTKISNGNWRNLSSYLTPAMAWDRIYPIPGKNNTFAVPPAVVQDEWGPLEISQWEMVFLSHIQKEKRLDEVVQNPEVTKVLPFKSRKEEDNAVEKLLEKVSELMAIVLIS